VKSSLSKVADLLRKGIVEFSTAYISVVTSLGKEIGSSQTFKEAIGDTIENMQILLAVISEVLRRSVSQITSRNELPASK
jgi:hypothetical protein